MSEKQIAYIKKLEEYIEFLTKIGKSSAIFCAIHGQHDSPDDIRKGEVLRCEIDNLKSEI